MVVLPNLLGLRQYKSVSQIWPVLSKQQGLFWMFSASEITSIKISNTMDCKHICSQAEKLIKKYLENNEDHSDLLLVMQVKRTIDGNMDYTKKLNFNEN